jgi:hypothetical protein
VLNIESELSALLRLPDSALYAYRVLLIGRVKGITFYVTVRCLLDVSCKNYKDHVLTVTQVQSCGLVGIDGPGRGGIPYIRAKLAERTYRSCQRHKFLSPLTSHHSR